MCLAVSAIVLGKYWLNYSGSFRGSARLDLENNQDIDISPSDKGGGDVLLNRPDYKEETDGIRGDGNTL